jgi:hypothetical protein
MPRETVAIVVKVSQHTESSVGRPESAAALNSRRGAGRFACVFRAATVNRAVAPGYTNTVNVVSLRVTGR